MKNIPTVVIVGRMNVGKSTLFNRLSENVKSITLDYEGVTRDVVKDSVEWRGRAFELIDTGGISLQKTDDALLREVRKKALAIVQEADAVIHVVDGIEDITYEDREVSDLLRSINKKTFLAVNKIDSKKAQDALYDFAELHHDELIGLSASHGLGIDDLLNAVVDCLPVKGSIKKDEPVYKVVLLGRPNVGKSSLMNTLLEQERALVSDIAGTTREALSEKISFYKEALQLTDTPGIRRKRSVEGNLEPLMVKSSMHALKDADIVVLMIDADQAVLVDQELKLAFYAFEDQHKALILLINKSDLFDERKEHELGRSFEEYEFFLKKIEKLRISCKTGKNIGRVLPLIKKVWERHSQSLPEEEIQELFMSTLQKKPLVRNRQELLVRKVKVLRTAPLTIGLQVNFPEFFGESQLKFFENLLRKNYDLVGVPVKFIVRKKL